MKPHRDFNSSREALNGPAPRTWCRAFHRVVPPITCDAPSITRDASPITRVTHPITRDPHPITRVTRSITRQPASPRLRSCAKGHHA
ncbi:hypothetical protein DMA12_04235 [Amycolatopsis balhimycina DSM 5908]|uniref:Uncharacterized protein n=1 Tax=Amycolatopsis balhimycina DSM 5908 TaxID=1081091 RepID=A0A428X2Q9_AMYBA|nr:hypothetical protein DMA12_04235 [Amycolatopsis balhimycina DSM 5908]